MWTVCRSVGPSFANPHNICLAYRLPLHFDPFAIPPRVAKFCAFGCQEYIKCIHNTWRAKMAKNIWTVCHKVFKPFAIRYLNRLPQDIWTVCHKTFIPFAYIPASEMLFEAWQWLLHTWITEPARKEIAKCWQKISISVIFWWTMCPQSMEKISHRHSLFACALPHTVYDFPIGKPYETRIATRHLNRLPQEIWSVCHKTFGPFATRRLNRLPIYLLLRF